MPRKGDKAPNSRWQVAWENGKEVTTTKHIELKDYLGKWVVLVLSYAFGCPGCKRVGECLGREWEKHYKALGKVQFIFISLYPDTLSELKDAVRYGKRFPIDKIGYPIVLRENGDWKDYVDEYIEEMDEHGKKVMEPDVPGIAIIDPKGRFHSIYNVKNFNEGVDFVARELGTQFFGRGDAVEIVLALDRSGSMADPPPLPKGSTRSKKLILDDAVGVFLDVWKAHKVAGDRIGVVAFESGVTRYSVPTSKSDLYSFPGEKEEVELFVKGLSTGDYTCMGGALAEGLKLLDKSRRRHIILFSDGIQNYNPVVTTEKIMVGNWEETSGLRILKIDKADVGDHKFYLRLIFGDSGISPPPSPKDLTDFVTFIHTIGVGLEGDPWTLLLKNIALETGGVFYSTPNPVKDLKDFFEKTLLKALRGGTPQLVKHTHGTYDPNKCRAQDSCSINGSAWWLTISLSWDGEVDLNRLVCNLEAPDGTLIDIHTRTEVNPGRLAISMPLPIHSNNRLVDPGGEWRLHITGNTEVPVPYQVFWLVEDRSFHFDVKPIDQTYHVGDTFQLEAELLLDGASFPANQIVNTSVRVASPVVDFNKFFDQYTIDPDAQAEIEDKLEEWELTDETVLKLYLLSQDEMVVAHCTQKQVEEVQMKYNQGVLTCPMTFTTPGVHQFDVNVHAVDQDGHPIVRTDTLSVYVGAEKWPEPDPKTLKTVFYARNATPVAARQYDALDANAKYLEAHPAVCVRIAGYAIENEGYSRRTAKDIAQDRANRVRQFYVDEGIDVGRIAEASVVVEPKGTPQEDEQNRRVETIQVPC